MNAYRVEFHAKGDAETFGLPPEAFRALFEALGAVSQDPWAHSRPDDAFGGDPAFRWVPFDRGLGAAHFTLDEDERTIRVYGITWVG